MSENVISNNLPFQWICSYLFYPIPLLIGVEIGQCREIAKVIGLKIFTTEIYAYQVLGQLYDQGIIDVSCLVLYLLFYATDFSLFGGFYTIPVRNRFGRYRNETEHV